MDAATNDNHSDQGRNGDGSRGPLRSTPARHEWIELYTSRILRAWLHQDAPLGLAWTYTKWIRQDLARCYRHPLMRAFIEETYRVTMD